MSVKLDVNIVKLKLFGFIQQIITAFSEFLSSKKLFFLNVLERISTLDFKKTVKYIYTTQDP